MLLNSSAQETSYYIVFASGQELGPYSVRQIAEQTLATLPLREDEAKPSIVPRTSTGQQVLFG